ncbi:MAG: hypothetical protein IPG55_04390 [Saprospiraceae bacterium]|jgi:hypothetical protein|nr:hypothetical protein [Candidatus Defluviibacterium haderslevense]MBK7244860.1 hypothetical protein [Candidatus Defluviibacterium haderslevense]
MKIILLISVFAIFVFFNLFIRIRTLKYYKTLVQKRIQFNFKQMFNKQLWEDEVLRKYPQDQQLLNHFRKHILITGGVFISIIFIVGISLSFILLK